MLSDTLENTEFKYFFVKKFDWLDPTQREIYKGHPKENRVYRGWHNKDSGGYRIAPSLTQALWLEKLKQEPGMSDYTSDIHEITKETILDFLITEEDLTSLATWIESDNKDLKQALFGGQVPPQIIAIIKKATEDKGSKTFSGFVESAEELQSMDPMAFEVIWGFMDSLIIAMHEEDLESFDADFLAKGKEGAVINISNAMKSLNRYIGDNRRTNRDPEDLYKAMGHITNEIIRSEINE